MCPRDQTLGMQATSLSPATTRMVGWTASEVSFAKTSELLAVLAGVAVETRQVERCAEALGREVAADERAVTEQTAPAPAPTLYLGIRPSRPISDLPSPDPSYPPHPTHGPNGKAIKAE